MLWHQKHTKFVPHKFLQENAQKDVFLNVTEVAELLGKDEGDIAAILREIHETNLTTCEDPE